MIFRQQLNLGFRLNVSNLKKKVFYLLCQDTELYQLLGRLFFHLVVFLEFELGLEVRKLFA